MDIKKSLLNGFIEEEGYFEQPLRFKTHNNGKHLCRLKKSLYVLKQAPRAWYGRIDGFPMNLGFTKNKVDSNLYYKFKNDGIMILLLYVDDIFLTGKENIINGCKKNIATLK